MLEVKMAVKEEVEAMLDYYKWKVHSRQLPNTTEEPVILTKGQKSVPEKGRSCKCISPLSGDTVTLCDTGKSDDATV
jgi:hypothetical protein